ncbi:MAG: TonB-dependent receptor [Endomicrobium sp.]|jgi:vitamin B12 transporter|nr:TonB-dependent receptor [Endomicrobium sp.]
MLKNISIVFFLSICLIFLGTFSANAQDSSDTAQDSSDSGTLGEVVVTASKHEESKREVPTNITVINGSDIQNSTATTMSQVMQQHGFQTYNPGGGSTQTLYIRGFGGSSMGFSETNYVVMILLNGHRTSNANLSLMNLINIDRIEIIRGPAAVQYGSSAMGGVVNIITKRGDGPLTATVEVGVGSDGRHDEKLAFSGSYSSFDYAFGFSHSHISNLTVAQENTGARRIVTKGQSIWRNTSISHKYGFDVDMGFTFLDTHRIGFHMAYSEIDDGLFPSGGFIATAPYPYDFAINNNNTYNYTFSYEGATSDNRFSWFTNYTHGKLTNKSVGYADSTNPFSWGGPYYPDVSYWSNNSSLLDQIQAQFTYDSLNYVSVTAGIDYYQYKPDTLSISSYGTTLTEGKITDLGFYLLAKLRLLDQRLIFTGGARYDNYKLSSNLNSLSSHSFTPSVGVAYSPVDFLKLRANYSIGFALPNTTQFLGDGSSYLPAPDLKPQESKTFEFGVDVSYNFFEGSITYFMTEFKNKIVGLPTNIPNPAGGTYSRFVNLNGATYKGIELDLRVDIAEAFNQDFSLTPYLTLTWLIERENKDQRPAAVVPISPRTMANTPNLMASYGIIFDYPAVNLNANLNASYFGKMYSQDWDTNPWASSWKEYGGFTTFNFSISKRILDFQDKGNVTLKVDANNLFNQYKGPVMNYPPQARNFYVGLVYNY